MTSLQQEIKGTFLAKLADSKLVDAAAVERLRKLLSQKQKPSAEEFVQAFTPPLEGETK